MWQFITKKKQVDTSKEDNMASWNGQNKRHKKQGFKKDRQQSDLIAKYNVSVHVDQKYKDKQIPESIFNDNDLEN